MRRAFALKVLWSCQSSALTTPTAVSQASRARRALRSAHITLPCLPRLRTTTISTAI